MANYKQKLLDPRWQKKRLKILERDDWKCQACGSLKNTLHIHHITYHKNPWDIDDSKLITLCENCHILTEHFKKRCTGMLGLKVFYCDDNKVVVSVYLNAEKYGYHIKVYVKKSHENQFKAQIIIVEEALITTYNQLQVFKNGENQNS